MEVKCPIDFYHSFSCHLKSLIRSITCALTLFFKHDVWYSSRFSEIWYGSIFIDSLFSSLEVFFHKAVISSFFLFFCNNFSSSNLSEQCVRLHGTVATLCSTVMEFQELAQVERLKEMVLTARMNKELTVFVTAEFAKVSTNLARKWWKNWVRD